MDSKDNNDQTMNGKGGDGDKSWLEQIGEDKQQGHNSALFPHLNKHINLLMFHGHIPQDTISHHDNAP